MMKHLAFLFAVLCLANSQRPPHAGSSNRYYPQVLPQYLQEQAATMPPSASTIAGGFGEGGSTTSTIPPDLPVDALGDVALVERIKTWPKEKQPFWYLNWQLIQENRGDTRFKQRVEPSTTFTDGTALPTRRPSSTSRDFEDDDYY